MKTLANLCLVAVSLGMAGPAAAGGADLARDACATCHALERPDYDDAPVLERATRQAPPLHYAGSKYRREWLVQWLQQPTPLRPAGYFPPALAETGDDGDRVDPAALPDHPALAADDARQVADHLLTLKAPAGLVDPDAYSPGTVPRRMGMLDFRKFKGCNACHRDAPGEGGVSGPELHSAWQRLQPDYIFAYVRNPTAWDPHSMMPVPQMNDAAVAKLVNYLKVIGEEAP